jgi:hypothetical protein
MSVTFANFTTNDTSCPIISHQIVVSMVNNSNPAGFKIVQSSSTFGIDYTLTGG